MHTYKITSVIPEENVLWEIRLAAVERERVEVVLITSMSYRILFWPSSFALSRSKPMYARAFCVPSKKMQK